MRAVTNRNLVVVTRISAKGRQRVETQQSACLRVDLSLRNHVAGEWSSGCRIEDLGRLPQRVQSLRQVSAALRHIRHQGRLRRGINISCPLVAHEKVRTVPKQMGNS